MLKSRNRLAEQPPVKLSCEQCQLRKTKCDREHPCGACQRAKLDCNVVQRRRLPRGRTAAGKGKGADLRDQIARLETILSNMASTLPASGQVSNGVPVTNGEPQTTEEYGERDAKYRDDHIWTTLNEKMVGIREALEKEFPETDSESRSHEMASPTRTFDIVLFGVSSFAINPSIIEPPPESSIYTLLTTYIHRVDPLYKMMHVPSLRTFLLAESHDFRNPVSTAASDALRFAVFFTAVCTLDETECRVIFHEDKNGVRDRFRLAAEVMLSRASLQTTRNITALQAFAVYLVGRRTCPGQKDISTLVACAVRIAQIVGLDADEIRGNPFQQEMRRRLWYSICILDMQAALDSGLRAIIAQRGSHVRKPMRINDADISPALECPPMELRGFTDMSFSAMTHDALLCWRRLNQGPADREGQVDAGSQDWAVRSQLVKDLERNLRETYLKYCDLSQPFQLFTKLVGEGMIVTMQLLERRPLHGFLTTGPRPVGSFDILQVARDILDASLLKQRNQDLAPWSWFSWAKWYALAVLLTELCGGHRGPKIDRAWFVAEASFPQIMDMIVDDTLRTSIEKLRTKAWSMRNGLQMSKGLELSRVVPESASSSEAPETSGVSDQRQSLSSSSLSWKDQPMSQYENLSTEMPGKLGPFGQPLPQLASNHIDEDPLVQDQEELAWINWEAFVNDVTDFNDFIPPLAGIA